MAATEKLTGATEPCDHLIGDQKRSGLVEGESRRPTARQGNRSTRSCQLTVGGRTKTLTGEAANALYATLAAAGVPSDGAAGSIFESVQGLACTLTPSVATPVDPGS